MTREDAIREIRRRYGVNEYTAADMLTFFHGGDVIELSDPPTPPKPDLIPPPREDER